MLSEVTLLGKTSLLFAGRYEICAQYHNAKPGNRQEQTDKLHSVLKNRNPLHEKPWFREKTALNPLLDITSDLFASIKLSQNRSWRGSRKLLR
ncbi:MAG: hypothetical protein CBE00_02040 [Planctomycetaceae bacterium TMED240]|nr:hypothetical protein [Rhodopirellula sp.]OUX08305.1 MAG: hypothetical protein CBE00_02040 [Planctomycetaceae bacterium TMED240]